MKLLSLVQGSDGARSIAPLEWRTSQRSNAPRSQGMTSCLFVARGAAWFSLSCLLSITLTRTGVAAETQLTPVADPAPLLAELQRKMSTLTTVYLEFDQERHLALFTEPLKSSGVMVIDRPDLIRWETTEPYQSILLGNRKSVAQFEQVDGKWKKLKLGFPQMLKRVMEQMSLMHQGKLDALTADFTLTVATGSVAVVTMVPKDKDVRSMLASLEIKMEPDFSATREVVMNEPNGDKTRILFRRERRGVKLPAETFDQLKPVGVSAIQAAANEAK